MRTVERIRPFLLSMLAACGGGGSDSPDAPVIVLEPDAPEVGPPTQITIDTVFDPPELVAVRDGTAPWRILPVSGTQYTTTVHGPYMVTVVCDDRVGGISVLQFVRTPEDETLLEPFCFRGDPTSARHQVTAPVVQAGTVVIGFQSQSSEVPNWQLDQLVDEGTADLIALSADKARIDRDLLVDAPRTLPAIDTATGTALVAAPLTATNARPGELLNATLSLFTQNSFAFSVVSGAPADIKVLPDSVLQPNDRQRVALSAFEAPYSRSVRKTAFHAGDATALTLPDAITGAQFTEANGVVTAKWGALPAHDSALATLFAYTSPDFVNYIYQELDIGTHAEGAKQVAFDTDIPGFKAEWKIDLSKEWFRTLAAFKSGVGETSSSFFDEAVNSSLVARVPLRPAQVEKLRARRELRRR